MDPWAREMDEAIPEADREDPAFVAFIRRKREWMEEELREMEEKWAAVRRREGMAVAREIREKGEGFLNTTVEPRL